MKQKKKQVAQGQYVVSDTRCPALHDCKLKKWSENRVAASKGGYPVGHRGEFL